MTNNEVILITGATSGIGRATVDKFAREGYRIVATGRDTQALDEVHEIYGNLTDMFTIRADLTQEGNPHKVITRTINHYGQLDSLINAAGIIATGTIETTEIEDWNYMFKLNVDTVFRLMQLAIPHLEQSSLKSIVNVSSVVGLRQFPGVLSYSVSKAALDQLTKVSALELAPKQIRVNAINPGVMETNLHKRGGMDQERYQEFLEHSRTTHPLGRVGQPEEAADLIYFLATDLSSWITGQTIAIDGGRSLTCFR